MPPLVPAALGESPSGHAAGVPYSPLYGDVYHPVSGAAAQARHIFLNGNGLPGRWEGRDSFVILETGFGLGNNFLTTWEAWREDPRRCHRLVFISIEKHPLSRADLARVHQNSPVPALAARLVDAWPVLTPGLHTLTFDDEHAGEVTLLLALGDVADLVPQIVARVDAFYLDGFAPARNPEMWDERWLSRLNRLAAPDCTAATWSAARAVREGLSKAGFVVEKVAGFGGKRDMTRATYQPRHETTAPPGGLSPVTRPAAQRHALIIGAGLAGAGAAWALARQGWATTVVDRQPRPAQEASGNPAGLFHPVIHGEDGLHARAHRAAALRTAAVAAAWIKSGALDGDASGLLRLDPTEDGDGARRLLRRLGLPPDHVVWLDQQEAATRVGLPLPSGGWWFPQGGWLSPSAYVRCFLNEAARRAPLSFLGCAAVVRVSRDEADGLWRAWGEQGQLLAEAPVVILAGGAGMRLAHQLVDSGDDCRPYHLPMSVSRGQISCLPSAAGLSPRHPVAGAGYVLPPLKGQLVFGATNQTDDLDPIVRREDHLSNLEQAAQLGCFGGRFGEPPLLLNDAPGPWRGRVGWRASTPDRLPYVGALPLSPSASAKGPRLPRLDQPRFVPRLRDDRGGVFIVSGFGSRGIGWAALAGELLASWVTGSPSPVEASLRDALDPGRIVARDVARRGARAG